jgi:hypothetical protein
LAADLAHDVGRVKEFPNRMVCILTIAQKIRVARENQSA